jgi:hypothetical protein
MAILRATSIVPTRYANSTTRPRIFFSALERAPATTLWASHRTDSGYEEGYVRGASSGDIEHDTAHFLY